MATDQTQDTAAQLIALRHEGASWTVCAETLGYTAAALKRRARRLRDDDKWRLPSGKPANGAPVRGQLGRPRKEVRSVAVSPRVTPEVAEELRRVAGEVDMLLGEIVAEAMYRASMRARGKPARSVPFGLERGEGVFAQGNRSETVSVNVPQPVYDDFVDAHAADEGRPMSLITDALHCLLADLGYTIDGV